MSTARFFLRVLAQDLLLFGLAMVAMAWLFGLI